MSELILQRVSKGRYALAEIGTLRNLPRFAAEIEAQGVIWTSRRAMRGFGQSITAEDKVTGARMAAYQPSGFLRLRGIYGGTIARGERTLEWGANRRLGSQFTLTERGMTVARFTAGSDPRPVSAEVADLSQLEPLLLLFCCHIVKQRAEAAKAGADAGATVAVMGG